MDAQQFLTWLAVGGGYSAVLAFIAERVPAFQTLSPSNKQLFHLVGSLAIALLAYAALTYLPKETLDVAKPYFVIVSGVLGTWMTGQIAHNADPSAAAKIDQAQLVTLTPPERKDNGDLRSLPAMDTPPAAVPKS